MKKVFDVEGMHCKSCKSLIEDEVMEIDSVEECTVSLENKTMDVGMSQDCSKKIIDILNGLKFKVKVRS